MANFTPIATFAPANSSVVNAPLYQLDAAIIALQSAGVISANRPWAVIGGIAQPTSANAVTISDDIAHLGRMVRGRSTFSSTGADMETMGNLAVGSGSNNLIGTNNLAVGGGHVITGTYSLAVGEGNTIGANRSLAVGVFSRANATNSVVFGNNGQVATNCLQSTVAGGITNNILNLSQNAAIVAGAANTLNNASRSIIGAGVSNQVLSGSTDSAIVSGSSNLIQVAAISSMIGAGETNTIEGSWSFVGAGRNCQAQDNFAFLGAGENNAVYALRAAIVAGSNNAILAGVGTNPDSSFIGAGLNNLIVDSQYAVLGGGEHNIINQATHSVIAGGIDNTVMGTFNFIGAGRLNTIDTTNSSGSAIIGGFDSTITGADSTVLGGQNNVIAGGSSVAAGAYCSMTHNNAFMWNSNLYTTFASANHGEFAASAYAGFRLRSNAARTTGMDMATGASSWTAVSARALKGEFGKVAGSSILERLLTVPIQTYRFKRQRLDEKTKQLVDDGFHDHINFGPTAEDWDGAFSDLFGKKTVRNMENGSAIDIPAISEGDKLGVAMAAIQGLASMVNDLKSQIADLRNKMSPAGA